MQEARNQLLTEACEMPRLGCFGYWSLRVWELFRVWRFGFRASRAARAAVAMGRMGPMGRMRRVAGGIAVPGGVHLWALPGSMGRVALGGGEVKKKLRAASRELRARRREGASGSLATPSWHPRPALFLRIASHASRSTPLRSRVVRLQANAHARHASRSPHHASSSRSRSRSSRVTRHAS